jgi:hypothetical protein
MSNNLGQDIAFQCSKEYEGIKSINGLTIKSSNNIYIFSLGMYHQQGRFDPRRQP